MVNKRLDLGCCIPLIVKYLFRGTFFQCIGQCCIECQNAAQIMQHVIKLILCFKLQSRKIFIGGAYSCNNKTLLFVFCMGCSIW